MKANDFVEGLRNINIEADLMKLSGLSDEFIEKMRKRYILNYRDDISVSTYPIIQLIENYDCCNLEIGMITFNEVIEETENYIYFGKFEIDNLVIDKITGKILMEEYDTDHIFNECAQNDTLFLKALLSVAAFLEKSSTDEKLHDNDALNIQMAEEFGDIAGGEDYYFFYKMLLGV
jgi:hypothetical protein